MKRNLRLTKMLTGCVNTLSAREDSSRQLVLRETSYPSEWANGNWNTIWVVRCTLLQQIMAVRYVMLICSLETHRSIACVP